MLGHHFDKISLLYFQEMITSLGLKIVKIIDFKYSLHV